MIRHRFPASIRGAWASPSRCRCRYRQEQVRKKTRPTEYALYVSCYLGASVFYMNVFFGDYFRSTWRRVRGKDVDYACRAESRHLLECLNQSGNQFSNCQEYLDSMQRCRKRAAAAAQDD